MIELKECGEGKKGREGKKGLEDARWEGKYPDPIVK